MAPSNGDNDRLGLAPVRNILPGGMRGHGAGGDEGIRTPDLCLAKAALFQLSYIPEAARWAILDSNQGPRPYQRRALTN